MNDDTQDDRTDAAIRDAARSYNVPPATPRDEMWARIQSRRVVPIARRQSRSDRGALTSTRWLWTSAAAAAVLVAGIGIGYSLRGGERTGAAPQPRTAATSATLARATATPPQPVAVDSQLASAAPAEHHDTHVAAAVPPHDRDQRRAMDAAPGDVAPDLAYRLAVVEHLARTEALLTSFRAEARNGNVDAQITTWARDLLRTTRLMESSAETQDPTMRRLLGDLELVLVQIAQYSATAQGQQRGEELDFIEQSIDRRGVLGKLRAAIPPGMTPAGT